MAGKPLYAIIRVAKHHTAGTIAGIGHHLDRTRETPNADANRMHLNRTWDGQRWVEWGDVPRVAGSHLDAVKVRLDDFKARGGTMQKNAVLVIEAIMTATPEAFVQPGFDLDAWVNAQIEYLHQKFGAANLVSAVLHMDEETPHVHALVVPEIQRVEKRGNKKTAKPPTPKAPKPALAASQWVGSRALLSELQSDYAAAMAPFGLMRGKERSGARHVPVSAYYAQGGALVEQVEQLTAEVARLRPQADRLPQVERQLTEAREKIAGLEAVRDHRDQRIAKLREQQREAEHDLGAIRVLKEHMPAAYEQVIAMADRQLARMAEAEIARMAASTPAEPPVDFATDSHTMKP